MKIKKTNLKIISSQEGSVMHSLRESEKDFYGFGESYFSTVEHNAIKAWKRHTKMTLNLYILSVPKPARSYHYNRFIPVTCCANLVPDLAK